jgi:hypothetical protein
MRKASIILLPVLLLLTLVGVSVTSSPDSEQTDLVERGKYLTIVGGCGDCHSPKVWTDHGPVEDSTRLFSGHPAEEAVGEIPATVGQDGWMVAGNNHFTAWAGPWGVSFASNLTSDSQTGIGSWTPDQFIKAMRTGKHRGFGRPILPPMPWPNAARATDDDLTAILAYFQSLPAIANKVPAPIPPEK